MRSRRFRAVTGISLALLLGGSGALVAAPAAFADVNVTMTPPSQTVEYGQSWMFAGQVDGGYNASDSISYTVTTGSTSATFDGEYFNGELRFGDYSSPSLQALGAGTHSMNLTAAGIPFLGPFATTTPFSLTITPAAIAATTTIAPDPNNSSNAIITSQLSGKFIDQLPDCQCDSQNGYLLPEGTWNLTVTDSQGKTVLTKSYDQAANGLPTFVNYWPSAPAGETFTAQSTFTVAGSAKSNFAITSQKFSYTSKKSAGEKGPGSPSAKPKPITVKNASFAPPVIVYWGALLVALIIAALNVILLLTNRRARSGRVDDTKAANS